MKDPPITPWLFRLQLEHTPSPHDPEGAGEFYEALGILVVAWGRLETHFLGCIMTILATDATKHLARKMPMAWEQRAKVWADAFRTSDALKPHEAAATLMLAKIKYIADERSKLVHGLWERFNEGKPLSIGLIILRHTKGTRDNVTLLRETVTIDRIRMLASGADQLNMELQTFSSTLNSERGLPPSNIHIP
jgi:hypothetical protein